MSELREKLLNQLAMVESELGDLRMMIEDET